MHTKHGKGAYFCSDPSSCPWKDVFVKKPTKQWKIDKLSEINKIDSETLHDIIYDEQAPPKIQVDFSVQNEVESINVLPAEYSQEGSQVSSIQEVQIEDTEEIDWNEVPSSLCAAEATTWVSSDVDFRPHLFDKQMDQFILIDSGSQCSTWPPDPGVSLIPLSNSKL